MDGQAKNYMFPPNLSMWGHKKTFHLNEMIEFSSERVENIVGRGENPGYQHFLLFQEMFSLAFCPVKFAW